MEVMKEYKISAQYLKNYKYDNQNIYNTLSLTACYDRTPSEVQASQDQREFICGPCPIGTRGDGVLCTGNLNSHNLVNLPDFRMCNFGCCNYLTCQVGVQ